MLGAPDKVNRDPVGTATAAMCILKGRLFPGCSLGRRGLMLFRPIAEMDTVENRNGSQNRQT